MRPVPRAVIDAFASDEYRRYRKVHKEAAPSIGTIEAARLLDSRELVYRGRAYSVAPIPWPLGSQILGVLEAFQHDPNVDTFLRAAHLLHQACKPVGFFRGLLYRVLNPWLKATRFEVGRYLGFCWMFHVLDLAGQEPRKLGRGISSRTSPASSAAIPRGSAPMATRFRGATS